ncbi:PQQ-dependent catabolism-associated CXXCW motif protein [Hwanghaeella grinnelliae]|uniref:PQQ-dependent catabolism-associated CXXCW motif protein n=1 Tax=Hwanghaeella grinnelliae TaxID=2500179 RepID=A0A437QUL2_9PROT|nr:PQQ-dependent catabolism-associated CXXCW motif protein [Hwanghaeella grinnelliae]RVU38210.1 PQQ-dependent catabolism-associated CXXCW motif protein [Hwanghaeella grinnelliae]
MIRLRVGVLLAALFVCGAAQAEQPAEPDGFRMDSYRAPVPVSLEGAIVLDDAGARALWQEGSAKFVDVLPRPPKPKNLPEGTIWRDKPRHSIPGATWLVNVGYGAIAEETDRYFRDGLAAVTGNDKAHPVVFFCLAECWMSWNAAKRALGYGYTSVYWYPNGTDGWTAQAWATEQLEPRP